MTTIQVYNKRVQMYLDSIRNEDDEEELKYNKELVQKSFDNLSGDIQHAILYSCDNEIHDIII